jgi:hypothetical protein
LILFAQGPVLTASKSKRLGKKEKELENAVFQLLLFFAPLLIPRSPVPERRKLSSVSDDNFWSRRHALSPVEGVVQAVEKVNFSFLFSFCIQNQNHNENENE